MPKKTIAKFEDFYGKEYQIFIFKALKNGEGEHEYIKDGRRVLISFSSPIDEKLAKKVMDFCDQELEKIQQTN
tara:strand:+ start:549 stop:767 length:219 start_codon:yes stop_codon:yes gene_type:complete